MDKELIDCNHCGYTHRDDYDCRGVSASGSNELLYSAHSLMGRGGKSGATAKMIIVHAVQSLQSNTNGDNFNTALCGKRPAGRSLGWHDQSFDINCIKCKKLLGI